MQVFFSRTTFMSTWTVRLHMPHFLVFSSMLFLPFPSATVRYCRTCVHHDLPDTLIGGTRKEGAGDEDVGHSCCQSVEREIVVERARRVDISAAKTSASVLRDTLKE